MAPERPAADGSALLGPAVTWRLRSLGRRLNILKGARRRKLKIPLSAAGLEGECKLAKFIVYNEKMLSKTEDHSLTP